MIRVRLGQISKWLKKELAFRSAALTGEIELDVKDKYIVNFRDLSVISQFTCISDQEFGGKSEGSLEHSKHGQAVFKGKIVVQPGAVENVKHSGFCGIRSEPFRGDFDQIKNIDIFGYSGMELRVRGDGRVYFFNIQSDGIASRTDDVFQALIHTRGGPYWEVYRIPFTHFLQTNQGYMQDHDYGFNKIRTVGFSISDRKDGPFHLELDYIKLISAPGQPALVDEEKLFGKLK